MKHRFQSDNWQHRYATPHDRRADSIFVASVLLAVLVVGGALFYALAPSHLLPTFLSRSEPR